MSARQEKNKKILYLIQFVHPSFIIFKHDKINSIVVVYSSVFSLEIVYVYKKYLVIQLEISFMYTYIVYRMGDR